jgi:hypothetical protein
MRDRLMMLLRITAFERFDTSLVDLGNVLESLQIPLNLHMLCTFVTHTCIPSLSETINRGYCVFTISTTASSYSNLFTNPTTSVKFFAKSVLFETTLSAS